MHGPFCLRMVTIEKINDYIQKVQETTGYWMVRTMGGDYYEEYDHNGFVAIGYNEITLHEINRLDSDWNKANIQLREKVKNLFPNISRPGHIASQLLRFCRAIKPGDIILLPSHASYKVSICRVTGSVYDEANVREGNGECPFIKRLPIKIIKHTTRLDLPPKAQLMFNSRHPISDISSYAPYLDNAVSDFYSKKDELHVVLKINTDEDVSTSTFYNIEKIFEIANGFCQEQNIQFENDDVILKVQMESKGCLHFISKNKNKLAFAALAILFFNGGGLKIDTGNFKLDLSTEGIFKAYNDYMDRKVDREIKESIKNSLDSLKIDTPKAFQDAAIELYKAQNAERNKY